MMKQRKKQLTALLLALVMTVGLLPSLSVAAAAVEDPAPSSQTDAEPSDVSGNDEEEPALSGGTDGEDPAISGNDEEPALSGGADEEDFGISWYDAEEPALTRWTDAGNYDDSWYNESKDEFTISSAEELAGLAALVNAGTDFSGKTVVLAADMKLAAHEWVPIGMDVGSFAGTLLGENHTVSGMRITDPSLRYSGFLGFVTGQVRSLTVAGEITVASSEIAGGSYGGLVGYLDEGTVTSCGAQVELSISAGQKVLTDSNIGGLVGYNRKGTIQNSYHVGGITVTLISSTVSRVGGVVGWQERDNGPAASCKNCYHAGVISTEHVGNVGSIAGCLRTASGIGNYLQNCYYSEAAGPEKAVGAIESTGSPTIEDNYSFDANQTVTIDGDSYPLLELLNQNSEYDESAWAQDGDGGYPYFPTYWTDAGNFDAGLVDRINGAEEPMDVTIATPDQLAALALVWNHQYALNVKLTDNIDLLGHLWEPISGFKGSFDGQGHVISNMDVRGYKSYDIVGLFGEVESYHDNYFRNFGLEGGSAVNTAERGSVAVICSPRGSGGNVYLYNCYSTVSAKADTVNLLSGEKQYDSKRAVDNCYAINGLQADGGEYWTHSAETGDSSAAPKTAQQLKALTATLNAWVGAQPRGVSYSQWYSSTQYNSGFPCFKKYSAPSHGGGGGGGSATYTLTFEVNGGSAIAKISDTGDTTIDLSAYKPTRDGYEFAGWYSDSDLTAKVTSVKLTKSMTVYAKWAEKTVESPFTDVADDAYYKEAVDWAVENGVTSGTTATTFAPNAICTRAQAVTFLWRAMGCPEPTGTTCPFTDVSGDAYYYKAVLWAVEQEITVGTSATTFTPNATVTRAQTVTFLWRAAGKPAQTAANPFADVKTGAYYESAVLWAVAEKITEGTTATTFSPANGCTRAQIVTFLYRYLGK